MKKRIFLVLLEFAADTGIIQCWLVLVFLFQPACLIRLLPSVWGIDPSTNVLVGGDSSKLNGNPPGSKNVGKTSGSDLLLDLVLPVYSRKL
jgi:hypothetical protein